MQYWCGPGQEYRIWCLCKNERFIYMRARYTWTICVNLSLDFRPPSTVFLPLPFWWGKSSGHKSSFGALRLDTAYPFHRAPQGSDRIQQSVIFFELRLSWETEKKTRTRMGITRIHAQLNTDRCIYTCTEPQTMYARVYVRVYLNRWSLSIRWHYHKYWIGPL